MVFFYSWQARVTIWNAEDRTWTGHMQGKGTPPNPHHAVPLAPPTQSYGIVGPSRRKIRIQLREMQGKVRDMPKKCCTDWAVGLWMQEAGVVNGEGILGRGMKNKTTHKFGLWFVISIEASSLD